MRTKKHNEKIKYALIARGIGKSDTKLCPRCEKILPRTTFEVRRNGQTASYCPPCEREYNRQRSYKHWIAHPELRPKQKLSNRKVKLKKFGLTVEQFDQMVQNQKGSCAICNGPPTRENLDIDHCHKTGKVRGLLCVGCNRGIGFFNDNKKSLQAAIDYLTKYE